MTTPVATVPRPGSGGGGGVTDHGALTGLDDLEADHGAGTIARWDAADFSPADAGQTSPGGVTASVSVGEIADKADYGTLADYGIAEPDGPVYDEATDQWICVFTASGSGTADGRPRALGALSADAADDSFTPHPQNPLTGDTTHTYTASNSVMDDPCIVKDIADNNVWRDSSNRALMFGEERMLDGILGHRGIHLFRSGANTLNDWVQVGRVLDAGNPDDDPNVRKLSGGWDDCDRTSPTVFHYDGTLYMLYEGRSTYETSNGQVGLATSDDEGATWTALANPILPSGDGIVEIVPDAIVKDDSDRWFMFVHAYTGAEWQIRRYVSRIGPDAWSSGDDWTYMDTILTDLPNFNIYYGSIPDRFASITGDASKMLVGNFTGATGVTDHGALTGLSDDDHTQYHTDARAATWADPRYANIATESAVSTNTSDILGLQQYRDEGTWVYGDGVGDPQYRYAGDVLAAGVYAVPVTGTLIDTGTINPAITEWDGTSDLDLAGGITAVFDWGAPGGGYLSGLGWALPATPPGLELIGFRINNLTQTGGALDDVVKAASAVSATTFSTVPGYGWASWRIEPGTVVHLFETAFSTDVAGSLGVEGYFASITFVEQDPVVAPPTSIEFASIEMLYRPKTFPSVTEIGNGDSPYAVVNSDDNIRVDTSGGAVEIDLPAATGSGRILNIKIVDATANTTIDGNGAETIDGAATQVLSTLHENLVIQDAASGEWDIK